MDTKSFGINNPTDYLEILERIGKYIKVSMD